MPIWELVSYEKGEEIEVKYLPTILYNLLLFNIPEFMDLVWLV